MLVNECILKRHLANPIITPKDFPGAYAIFNPGQTTYNGKTWLLVPVGHNSGSCKGKKASFTAHVALSDDGVHFDISPEPLFVPSQEHPYSMGAMLLYLNDPEKIIGLTKSAILAPYEPYEFNGIVPNAVFPAGTIGELAKDEVHVHYGCADTYIGLATDKLSQLAELCRSELEKN